MSFEIKEKQIYIFKNHKKETEKQPDYNASLKVDGVEYEGGVWLNEGKKGKYMSGKLKVKGEVQRKPPKYDDGFDDDIPF